MKRKNVLSMSLAIGVAATSIFALSWEVEAEVPTKVTYDQQKVEVKEQISEPISYRNIGEEPIAGITVSLSKVKNYKIKEKEPAFKFSKDETNILYRIVEAECTERSIEDKKNVTSVIIQRTLSDSFPDTIEDVVFQKTNGVYQFSPIRDSRYHKVDITEETKKAVDDVIENGTSSDALYFFNLKDVSSKKIKRWINNKLEFVMRDDSHSFYKEK